MQWVPYPITSSPILSASPMLSAVPGPETSLTEPGLGRTGLQLEKGLAMWQGWFSGALNLCGLLWQELTQSPP